MLNVMVAGDDPVIDRLTVKRGRGGGGSGEEGVRIGKVFRAQRVEANGQLLSFGSCERVHGFPPQAIPPRGATARTPAVAMALLNWASQ